MKRSLFVVCALGSSIAAHAQSQVTLQGTADANLNYTRGSLTHRSQLNSGGNSTSKVIFRGVEDLGGGLYAQFWLESGFLLDNGTGTASNTNNQPSGTANLPAGTQAMTFNRRSIVGLGGNWGLINIGREWSPTYDAFTSRYDLFGVGVGIGLNYTSSINPNQVRVSNDISYTTPKVLGGLSVNVQHWMGENTSGTATSRDGTGSGIRLNYDNDPISAVAHYARTDFAAGDAIYRGVAAYYDPGDFKLAFNANHDEQGRLKQRGWNIGGLYRIGVGEIKGTVSRLRTNAAGNPEGTKYAIGYVHNLSKRTAVYTTYARIQNKNGATFAISGSTTAPNRYSSGFDLGIRHHF